MPHRYFSTEISDGTATLRGADAHHLARVMRARLGDTVILCDGNAVEYIATITGFGDECVEFRWSRAIQRRRTQRGGHSAGRLPQAGQAGTDHQARRGAGRSPQSCPFFSRYCVAAPKKEEQKNERYNRIAVEAASSAAGAFCRMWPCRWQTSGPCAAPVAQYDLVLFCYECGGAPLRDLLAQQSPPMVKS